jgi:hypothetical protein
MHRVEAGQDRGGMSGPRPSAARLGPHDTALRPRRFRRKPSPAASPCAPSASSSNFGKRGAKRLRSRRPRPSLASREGKSTRPLLCQGLPPSRSYPTILPLRPRNRSRGRTIHRKFRLASASDTKARYGRVRPPRFGFCRRLISLTIIEESLSCRLPPGNSAPPGASPRTEAHGRSAGRQASARTGRHRSRPVVGLWRDLVRFSFSFIDPA